MRIVGGTLGGRVLRAPGGAATRPTSEKVREAVFAILGSILGSIEGAHVLDLFAGTGALGLEALSRGAAHATFVDSARPAVAAIRGNLRALGLEEPARRPPRRGGWCSSILRTARISRPAPWRRCRLSTWRPAR